MISLLPGNPHMSLMEMPHNLGGIAGEGDHGHEIVVIVCTISRDASGSMARQLVDRRLAACVNVMPVQSFYRWEGEFCNDAEVLLLVKTRREMADMVVTAIREIHPYELPEIIVLPVIAGHAPYLDWVYNETRPGT
jgi:periplasmic divalent cation tolerance protein